MALKRKSQPTQHTQQAKRPALKQASSRPARPPAVPESDDDFISDDGADLGLLSQSIRSTGADDDEEDSGDSDGEGGIQNEFVDDEAEESDDDGEGSSEGENSFVVDDHHSVSGSDEEDGDEVKEAEGEADMEDLEGGQPDAQPKEYNKKKGSSLYHPPTNDEMQALKSATSLFKSPLFSLLLSSLLPSVRPLSPATHPAPPALAALLSTLQTLRPFLLALKKLAPTSPRLTLQSGDNLPYPGQGPKDDSKWLMEFVPPVECQITGGWPLETVLSHRPSKKSKGKGKEGEVELSLIVPEKYFQEKDFLNGRWAFKRVYWLGVVGRELKKAGATLGLGEVEWRVEEGAEWTPKLVVKSVTDKSANDFSKLNLSLVLTPVLPTSLFPTSKLSPLRNALRPSSDVAPPPTPNYNAALLSTSLAPTRLLYLHALSVALPSLKDASILLQLWGSKRSFGLGLAFGTPSNGWREWVELVLGYLVFGGSVVDRATGSTVAGGGKKVGKGMSSYQVFRAVLDFFAHHAFDARAVFVQAHAKSPIKPIDQAEFVRSSAVGGVFVGPEGTVNVLQSVERGVLEVMAREAKGTLDLLDEDAGMDGEGEDNFERVFLRGGEVSEEKFDVVFRIDLSTAQHQFKGPLDRLDEPSRINHLLARMSTVLRRALGTRVKLVALQRSVPSSATTTWSLGTARPNASDASQIVELGLILDQTECWRLVDAGPSADDEAAGENFRQFWGDKSELRRFKDGRIIESVVWDIGSSEGERSLIVGRSVRHILKRHFGLDEDAISTESMVDYLPLIQLPESAKDLLTIDGATEGFRPAQEAYTEFVATLRSLEDKLPLSLLNVFPVAQGLRYTSVFPPLPIDEDRLGLAPDCLKFVESLDIVVQFESSGKWPDDLTAIQKIKLAFLHKMAELFSGAIEGSRVSVAVDDCDDVDEAVIRDNCSLEVFHPSGFAFRLRIHHDREKTLLDMLIADKKNVKPRTRKAAQKALDLHLHRFVALPRHHSAIAAIHHLHPSFTTTVRLVTRWLSAHMLSDQLSAELVELVCATVYLTPTPYAAAPASHSVGFARVISILARWKWSTMPIVLPLYSTAGSEAGQRVVFPADKRAQALEAFKKARATDVKLNGGAYVVVTEQDLSGRVFGAVRPGKLVAARVSQLAKATLACLDQNGRDGTLNVEQLFKTPLTDYNFLIHLKSSIIPRAHQAVSPVASAWATKYKNASSLKNASATYGKELRIDFDPVGMYLREVERAFGDVFILFHDARGGLVIGGLWNPSYQQPRNFKVQLDFSSEPVALKGDAKSQMVVLNQAGLIAELQRLGEGLVERIEVRGP